MFVLNAYFCRELKFVAILRSKLRFLLRNTGVDSDFTQNFWGKIWWLKSLVIPLTQGYPIKRESYLCKFCTLSFWAILYANYRIRQHSWKLSWWKLCFANCCLKQLFCKFAFMITCLFGSFFVSSANWCKETYCKLLVTTNILFCTQKSGQLFCKVFLWIVTGAHGQGGQDCPG